MLKLRDVEREKLGCLHGTRHATLLEVHVPVGDTGEPGEPMLSHEDRAPLGLGMPDEARHVRDGGEVEVARRLVQKQDRGVHGPDARAGHLLTLATREPKDVATCKRRQTKLLEGLAHARADVLLLPSGTLQREGHLAGGVHVEELGARVLEERAHPLGDLPTGKVVHVPAIERYAAVLVSGKEAGRKPIGQAQKGRFSTPRASAEHDQLAGGHRQRRVPDHGFAKRARRAVREGDVLEADHASTFRTSVPTIATRKTESTT